MGVQWNEPVGATDTSSDAIEYAPDLHAHAGEEAAFASVSAAPGGVALSCTAVTARVQDEDPTRHTAGKIFANQPFVITATFKQHAPSQDATSVRLWIDSESQDAEVGPLDPGATQDIQWFHEAVPAGEHGLVGQVLHDDGSQAYALHGTAHVLEGVAPTDVDGTTIEVPRAQTRDDIQHAGLVAALVHLTMVNTDEHNVVGLPLTGNFRITVQGVPTGGHDVHTSTLEGQADSSGFLNFPDSPMPSTGSIHIQGWDGDSTMHGSLGLYELHGTALYLNVKRSAFKAFDRKFGSEDEAKTAGHAAVKAGFDIKVVKVEPEVSIDHERSHKDSSETSYEVYHVAQQLEVTMAGK